MWSHTFLCLKHAIYILKEKNKLDNLIPYWIYSLCSDFCGLLLCLVILVLHFCERCCLYPETYGYENWTIKVAEHQRIDTFELWCKRKLLRVPWTVRKSSLKQINPEYSLEGLMLKLKPQYFGHLVWRADSLEKDPDAGKNWRQMGKGAVEDEMIR